MKTRLTDHLGLKLLSLLMGFSLWYAVAREQGAEFAFTLPLELRNVPEGLEVIDESAQQVDVRLRGPSELLRRITPSDIVVAVDLSDAVPGERVAYLTPSDVTAPFGARVMRVTPTSVTLELDRTVGRTVEVIPRVLGSPAEGFEILDIELEPKQIGIVGPASRLVGIDQVTTEPVSADGLRESYSRSLRVELDPLVRLSRETNVEITLQVGEERLRKEIANVPVTVNPETEGVRLSARAVRVVVEGPRSVVEPLAAADLVVELPISELASGRHDIVPVARWVADELAVVEVVGFRPETVGVRIP